MVSEVYCSEALAGALSEIRIFQFGRQATLWSMSLFALTLAFAMTSIASAISLWRVRTKRVRKLTLLYGVFVAPALLIAVAYFAYWGVIGLRTWS